jgi:urease accessory protein
MNAPASSLAVARSAGRSVVIDARARSPLRLLNPKNHGHAAWVYQASFGGGFVGGDDLSLGVDVGEGATLFLTTQASGKAYRSSRARFRLEAAAGPAATLVWWPDPLACFAGSSLAQTQRFALADGANLLYVDAVTAGRVARGERWAFARLASRLEIDVGGAPLVRDALVLDGAHGPLTERLSGINALATVVLVGPNLGPLCDRVADVVGARPLGAEPLAAASRWPWGLVLRLAAPSTASLLGSLAELLRAPLAELLEDDPWARKW